MQALLRPAAATARLYATKAARSPLASSPKALAKPAEAARKPEMPKQKAPASMGSTTKPPSKKKPSSSTSTAAAAPKNRERRSPKIAEQQPKKPRKGSKKVMQEEPLPDKLVRWRTRKLALLPRSSCKLTSCICTVSVEWRAILESNTEAAKWRALNLTPNTLCNSPLANADGSITLFEGRTASGQVRLFYSMDHINAARTAMLDRGVPKAWLKETWDDAWVWPAEQIKELKAIRFKDGTVLRYRLTALKVARAALKVSGEQAKNSAAPAESSASATPSEPTATSASAAYRKRLASATFLPTPPPSVESSPEPSSSLPSEPKKPRPTLTAAQEAAKVARDQKSLVKWNKELDITQAAWLKAKAEGGAAFLSLDVEMWERSLGCLLEFGWSVTEFVKEDDGSVTERRDDQHISESRFLLEARARR